MRELTHLSDLSVGQVYWMKHPKRVCKVKKKHKIETVDPITQTISHEDGYEIQTTLPIVPIEGFCTQRDADEFKRILAPAAQVAQREGHNGLTWKEIWTVRAVPTIDTSHKAPRIMETRPRPQVYVHSEIGRSKRNERTSPARSFPVVGELIPSAAVPKGLFKPVLEDKDELRV